ncbi:hypothetical protein ACFLRN_04540 [Thermoproteota archaeon]
MIIQINEENIILDGRARGPWCMLPYPNHPRGCPNYGKKPKCPPFSKTLHELIVSPFYLVVWSFDLDSQANRMKKLHPKWSDKQARCLLYWQGSVRKKLLDEARTFINSKNDNLVLLEIPEANGVDVFKTCNVVGIPLERKPKKLVRKVMLIGKKFESNTIEI